VGRRRVREGRSEPLAPPRAPRAPLRLFFFGLARLVPPPFGAPSASGSPSARPSDTPLTPRCVVLLRTGAGAGARRGTPGTPIGGGGLAARVWRGKTGGGGEGGRASPARPPPRPRTPPTALRHRACGAEDSCLRVACGVEVRHATPAPPAAAGASVRRRARAPRRAETRGALNRPRAHCVRGEPRPWGGGAPSARRHDRAPRVG
jgi:hypothetical protein